MVFSFKMDAEGGSGSSSSTLPNWDIYLTREQSVFRVNETVNLTLHGFKNGERVELPELNVTITNQRHERFYLQPVQIGVGEYLISFQLEESHLWSNSIHIQARHRLIGEYTLEYNIESWELPLEYPHSKYEYTVGDEPTGLKTQFIRYGSYDRVLPGEKFTLVLICQFNQTMVDPTNVDIKADGKTIHFERWGVGIYGLNYTVPDTHRFNSTSVDFVEFRSTVFHEQGQGTYQLFSNYQVYYEPYRAWYKWKNIEEERAVLLIGVVEKHAHPVGGVKVEVPWSIRGTDHRESGVTNASGVVEFTLDYSYIKKSSSYLDWAVWVNGSSTSHYNGNSVDIYKSSKFSRIRLYRWYHDYLSFNHSHYQQFQMISNNSPMPAGEEVKVIYLSDFGILHEGNYHIGLDGALIVQFDRPEVSVERGMKGMIYVYYNNSSTYSHRNHIECIWFSWENGGDKHAEDIEMQVVEANGTLLTGSKNSLKLHIPDGMRLKDEVPSYAYNSEVRFNVYSQMMAGLWAPISTYQQDYRISPFMKEQEVVVQVPPFYDEDHMNVLISIRKTPSHYYFQNLVLPVEKGKMPATIWESYPGEDDASNVDRADVHAMFAQSLLLLLVVIVALFNYLGRQRERELDEDKATQIATWNAGRKARRRELAADPDHWKPRNPP